MRRVSLGEAVPAIALRLGACVRSLFETGWEWASRPLESMHNDE